VHGFGALWEGRQIAGTIVYGERHNEHRKNLSSFQVLLQKMMIGNNAASSTLGSTLCKLADACHGLKYEACFRLVPVALSSYSLGHSFLSALFDEAVAAITNVGPNILHTLLSICR
jgi:hypothetical protein